MELREIERILKEALSLTFVNVQSDGSHFQCYSLQMTVPESSWTYIRVLATPTTRWTNCEEEGIKCPKDIPTKIHERAWSSPIWFYDSE